jgi:hypothetical protein
MEERRLSRDVALANIRLESSPRWGHTEYSLGYHSGYFRDRTGLLPEDPRFGQAVERLWQIDFGWSTDDGLRGDWGRFGRATDMGHAVYATDGSDQRAPAQSPFSTPEEVWTFDAVGEYGLPTLGEQVAAYERSMRDSRASAPSRLTTGGYYKTVVSGAIAAFGWEMFLEAAANPARMERVFESFARRTRFHMEAWAQTSAEAIIQHDDFVWTSGAFMHPDIYRRIIIPLYADLWKPLRAAGKKILFCSDGDFTEFAGDIVDAGADGLIFEPLVDFGRMVDAFGGTTCLVGSYVDCRDLTFGNYAKVRQDIDRTFDKLAGCRGAILAVGNHLPGNIPAEAMDGYMRYLGTRLAEGRER